jgi:protein-S-isoprenylcysteine O-methyltransferase Ste14
MLRGYIRLILYILFVAAILFVSAGRLYWLIAWVFLGIYTVITLIGILFVDPELMEDRSHIGPGAKRWDIALASLAVVFLFPAMFLIVGLDVGGYHWSSLFPFWIQLSALLVFVMGSAIQSWAIITNKFYSSVVRIQTERVSML